MHVPRLCPAGFVCDVTGLERAEQPCPAGHFCLAGTATTATTCGSPGLISSRLTATLAHREMSTTLRRARPGLGQASGSNAAAGGAGGSAGAEPAGAGPRLTLGARNAACWDNSTSDMGLQYSPYPARFWAEAHKLPLAPDARAVFAPGRGRYCLDDRCLALGDTGALSVSDASFDYASQDFALRRPVPCPPGTFCAPGTAFGDASEGSSGRDLNLTLPQPCAESMYCPEGSDSPAGLGLVAAGFYAPYGVRLPCPAGTFCAFPGQWGASRSCKRASARARARSGVAAARSLHLRSSLLARDPSPPLSLAQTRSRARRAPTTPWWRSSPARRAPSATSAPASGASTRPSARRASPARRARWRRRTCCALPASIAATVP
jgi:hypothetical protein